MIRLQDLSLKIGPNQILSDVSLEIAQGKVTGLVGESGSGKSMTALAMMQLAPRGATTSGQILLEGEDLLPKSEDQMCAIRGDDIGMIFQEPMTALNPVQPIGQQVAETLIVHGKATRRNALDIARRRLDRVGLPAEQFPLNRYPHELSGGQRQRVCIAMAVALSPRLLIADEPSTALDVTTQAQILDLLKSLVDEQGMSLLLITHDLAVVANMADHVAVMQNGAIVEQGETSQLFRNMRHPYTKTLFAASAHQPQRQSLPKKEPLLVVKNAVRDYRTARQGIFGKPSAFRAVDSVSFQLNRGESLGLVGESGCGKSTLTRAILGLDPLQGGTIHLGGAEIIGGRNLASEVRRRMQIVFQDPYGSFNPRWKVSQLVAEPFFLMAQKPPDIAGRVNEALDNVGLPTDAANRYIHEFSGGQRQRIAIARALITRPDLIILDEAVSALDVSVRAQILDLLADLQATYNLSFLFISHDLSVVRSITDRVLVMRAGQIVETGETEQVFTQPKHPYTQSLIAASPVIPTEWQGTQHA